MNWMSFEQRAENFPDGIFQPTYQKFRMISTIMSQDSWERLLRKYLDDQGLPNGGVSVFG